MKHLEFTIRRGFLVLLVAFSVIPPMMADSWMGFRGLARIGNADGANPPVFWSRETNILWQTDIKGEGHSSPIVHGNSVYLTTSYLNSRHRQFINWLQRIAIASTVALLTVGIGYQWRRIRTWSFAGNLTSGQLVGDVLRGALLISFAAALLYGQQGLFYEENPDRIWRLSLATVMGLGIMNYALQPSASLWWFLGSLVLFGYSIAFYWAIPDPRDLWEPAAFWGLGAIKYLIPVTTVVVGSIIIFLLRRNRRLTSPMPTRLDCLWLRLGFTFFFIAALGIFLGGNYLRLHKELVRAVVCLDLDTGKVRWVCEGLPGRQAPLNSINSPATPTPVTDGDRVYAYFGSAGLMCVSQEGQLLWTRTQYLSQGRFGCASSPVLFHDKLFLLSDVHIAQESDRQKYSYLTSLNSRDGSLAWEVRRPSHALHAGYSSPVLDLSTNEPRLWVQGWQDLKAYDPDSGKEIYSQDLKFEGHHLVASPLIDKGQAYVSNAKQLFCMNQAATTFNTSTTVWKVAWTGEISSSPVLANGLIFSVTEDGRAACIDSHNGRCYWQQRLPGRYFSSVLAAGNRIYFFNEAGQTTVITAAPDYRLLARNSLDEKIYASAAPTGDRLLVRSVKRLYCLGDRRLYP